MPSRQFVRCLLFVSLISPTKAPAQSLLTFAGGGMANAGYSVSWSVGEIVVSTTTDGENAATQGYQQPAGEMEMIDTNLVISALTVNVITPNGDGINEEFVIEHLEDYPDNRLVIINRWREVVFQADGYQGNWKGQELPQAAYYYTFYFDKDDKKKLMRGTIHILRK